MDTPDHAWCWTMGLLMLIIGAALAITAMNHHYQNKAPDASTVRELCVDLGTQVDYPAIYVQGRGCVILIHDLSGEGT